MATTTVYSTVTNYGATVKRATLPSYEDFATIRSGNGTTLEQGTGVYAAIQKAASGYYELMRGGLVFNTNGVLTYPAKITAASIYVYLLAKNNSLTGAGGITLVNPNPASLGSWAASDYQRFTTTAYSSNYPISSMADAGNWISFALNSTGLAAINKVGLSAFGFRVTDDVDGSISPIANSWDGIQFRQNHESYPGYDPYITITYEYPLKVNIGDVWKDVIDAQVNIGDSWKSISELQVNISDVWKVVF